MRLVVTMCALDAAACRALVKLCRACAASCANKKIHIVTWQREARTSDRELRALQTNNQTASATTNLGCHDIAARVALETVDVVRASTTGDCLARELRSEAMVRANRGARQPTLNEHTSKQNKKIRGAASGDAPRCCTTRTIATSLAKPTRRSTRIGAAAASAERRRGHSSLFRIFFCAEKTYSRRDDDFHLVDGRRLCTVAGYE